MNRRRPGQSKITSSRNESDEIEILSGVFENKTLGTPITIIVKNMDQRSKDYSQIKNQPRQGHADDLWLTKYGHSDHRGGGRASGRETVSRVIAGSVAEMFLQQCLPELKILAFTNQVSEHKVGHKIKEEIKQKVPHMTQLEINKLVDQSASRVIDPSLDKMIDQDLIQAKESGLSFGGSVEVFIQSCPANLGRPVFKKLKSELASAMMSLGAAVGFELGSGFDVINKEGSEFHSGDTDVYGGVRGGISTGEVIQFRVAFKPTSSVLDVAKQGRHDPCIVPRAVVVVQAMAYLVLADQMLAARLDRV